MRIYIAARIHAKDFANDVARALGAHGHQVTSTWHYVDDGNLVTGAVRDLTDVLAAEAVLVLHDTLDAGAKGAWTEMGIAIGAKRMVFVFGTDLASSKNIFTHLPGVFKIERTRAPIHIDLEVIRRFKSEASMC